MGKGRAPCCDKSKVKKGPWSCEEDLTLISFIQKHGHHNWRSLPKQAGLLRCGKSCRLRWINYLRPDVKRGNFTPQEEETIIKLHQSFGNKWSKIASHLPGRTDNEIKNVWNTHLKKRLMKWLDAKKTKLDDSPSSSTSILSHANEGELKNDEYANIKISSDQKEEATKSCSPTSSYASSNLSNSSQVHEISSPNNITVDMDWIFQFNEETFPSTTTRKVHDHDDDNDGIIEIPLECEVDFWDLLDIMGPTPPNSDQSNTILESEASQSVCESVSEFEYQKWYKYFENELGV